MCPTVESASLMPWSAYCGTSQNTLMGTTALGLSGRPWSAATRRRLASTSAPGRHYAVDRDRKAGGPAPMRWK